MTLRFWDLELHLFFIGRRKSEWSDGTGVQRRGRRGEIDEHARAAGGDTPNKPPAKGPAGTACLLKIATVNLQNMLSWHGDKNHCKVMSQKKTAKHFLIVSRMLTHALGCISQVCVACMDLTTLIEMGGEAVNARHVIGTPMMLSFDSRPRPRGPSQEKGQTGIYAAPPAAAALFKEAWHCGGASEAESLARWHVFLGSGLSRTCSGGRGLIVFLKLLLFFCPSVVTTQRFSSAHFPRVGINWSAEHHLWTLNPIVWRFLHPFGKN